MKLKVQFQGDDPDEDYACFCIGESRRTVKTLKGKIVEVVDFQNN